MTAPPESAACFLTHLECSQTGEHHPAGVLHGLSRAGAPLFARYDLGALAAAVDKDTISRRPPDSGATGNSCLSARGCRRSASAKT